MLKSPIRSSYVMTSVRAGGVRGGSVAQATDDAIAASDQAAARILIVEDDYLVAAELEAVLTDAGFRVLGVARSAAEAVSVVETERPQLAIVDIRLDGDRDGVELAQALLRDHGVRTIFATAHSDAPTRERAKPARPVAWVAKPYNPTRLVPMIRTYLAASDR